MAVANFNRKILDLKKWTMMTAPSPVASGTGTLVISSRLKAQRQMFVYSATVQYLYDPFEDGFGQIPSAALAGTFGAGTCGTASAVGPSGTATGGAASAINTGLNLQQSLIGFEIQILSGPGAGDVRTIAYNTVGANSVVTVAAPFSATPTGATTFRLLTPRWYLLNAGTLAAGSFRVYDYALNTWTTLANTGLPATLGTDAKMLATPSIGDNGVPLVFAAGTATGATATTLANAAKAWAVNQWSNYQVRITAGTGAGQIRSITSNTATALTVTAWTIQPDATSVYVIEGNDDFLYIMGNNAVTLYRYSISGNTSVTLTPTAARAAAPVAGMSGQWVYGVTEDARWAAESDIINGRRIYSFRGGAGAVLDYYDVALNTWVSGVPYTPAGETFTTGSKYVYAGNWLYIHKDATGRWLRYSFAAQRMDGWSVNVYPGGAGIVGDTAFDAVEPETGIRFVMMQLNTSTALMRCMVV